MSHIPKIVPITDLRQDATSILREAVSTHEPVFITQRGRASAVVVSIESYERTQELLAILRALVKGEREIEAGKFREMESVFADIDKMLDGMPE